jgi:hypothetical protein
MILPFIQLIIWLDNFVRVGEEEFSRAVPAIRSDLVRCYAALIQYGSQMQGVTPAFTAMYRSLISIECFHREYARNRPALRLAMLECAVFQPFRAMLLHDEGWRALCDAINSMKQLHDLMPTVNPQVYFARYSPQCVEEFQLAVDELQDDGHEIDGIQHALTMCTNSLQSYESFTEQYAASHAAIVSAVMNIQLPFVPELPL